MSDRQFFALTPRQLHLLLDRKREQTRHEELLMGILAATFVNHSMSPPEKPVAALHFMPSEWAKKRERAPRVNRQRVAGNIRMFLEAQAKARATIAE